MARSDRILERIASALETIVALQPCSACRGSGDDSFHGPCRECGGSRTHGGAVQYQNRLASNRRRREQRAALRARRKNDRGKGSGREA